MILLIYGASHSGKTKVAQRLIEKYHYPMISIDHLKMGLIRSNVTSLTVEDDEELTEYLWPIVSEMIKTAIENNQHMIVEGVYIPHDFKNSFDEYYLNEIKSVCLILSEAYIRNHYDDIINYRNVIEQRLGNDLISQEELLSDNAYHLEQSIKFGNHYYVIEDEYNIDLEDLYD